jgi:hypothetical protein
MFLPDLNFPTPPAPVRASRGGGGLYRSTSVPGARLATTDDASFKPYTDFYAHENLGDQVDCDDEEEGINGITPTKFQVVLAVIELYGDNGNITATVVGPLNPQEADFAQNVIIAPGTVPPGHYDIARFIFNMAPTGTPSGATLYPWVEFPKPDDMDDTFDFISLNSLDEVEASIVDDTVRARMNLLDPATVNNSFTEDKVQDEAGHAMPSIHAIIAGGSTSKLLTANYNGSGSEILASEVLASYPHVAIDTYEGAGTIAGSYVVVPFEGGIDVPEGASAVSFTLNWDLDGIIERYEGLDEENITDDIFVLKNGWWEGLSINAVIE